MRSCFGSDIDPYLSAKILSLHTLYLFLRNFMLTVCAGSKYSLHVFKRFFVRIRVINFGENKTRIHKVVEDIF